MRNAYICIIAHVSTHFNDDWHETNRHLTTNLKNTLTNEPPKEHLISGKITLAYISIQFDAAWPDFQGEYSCNNGG